MTELLTGVVEVRLTGGAPTAIRPARRWLRVTRVINRWLVEIDWWRVPVRRHYHRCLMADGQCLEIYHDLEAHQWRLARRYD